MKRAIFSMFASAMLATLFINHLKIKKMDIQNFINEQVELLNNDFGTDQIQGNVYRLFFKEYMPDLPLNSIISRCMEVYAQIIKIHSAQPLFKALEKVQLQVGQIEHNWDYQQKEYMPFVTKALTSNF